MKRRVGVIGVAVIALLALPLRAQATPYGLQRGLDDVVSAAAVGAQAEVHDGAAVWRGRSGVTELGSPRPVPLTGQFRIGSITKTFLATVTLQLVAEKRLGLGDPVARWLPGLPTNGATVRQLMNHTSGLYDVLYTLPRPPQPEFYVNRYRTWTNDELIQRALANPPTSIEPGKVYKYSNTNYLLLAKIVEKITGHTYAFEIEHRLIRRLHLHDTTVPGTNPRIPGPHAHGYVTTPDGALLDFTSMNPSLFGAAGEMISSTRDLDRFLTALLGGHLLPPALLHQMKTPGVENGHYGLGLAWKKTACGTTVYGNDGDALTYQAWFYATEDLHRRATLFVTPTFTTNPDPAVDAFLNKAFCN